MELPLEVRNIDMEITESEDISPMDTDEESNSGMDTAEERKIECMSSPIIDFIGAIFFAALMCHISRVYRARKAFESTSIRPRAH